MQIRKTEPFERDFKKLPKPIRKKAIKSLRFLAENLRHPSIQSKKIKGAKNIWEARVNRFYRFTFQTKRDLIILRRIGPHNHTLKNP